MNEDQFTRLLWMLEALRIEIRASALVQQRSEGAATILPAVRQDSDGCARQAGVFGLLSTSPN